MTKRGKSISQSVYTTTTGKTYKVTISYIEVTEDEARIKRSIVESILKKAINRTTVGFQPKRNKP